MATFNPIPQLGGANWSGNQSVATLRQLLSTSQGLANNGDSNFDAANISTLYVSTITGFYNGTQTINIQNTSSINISSFKNVFIDANNFTLTANLTGLIKNNGLLVIDNKEPITGTRTTTNTTDILCGQGSFQALAGNMTVAGSETLNLYGGDKVLLETAWSQNNQPDGVFNIAGNNLIGVRSLSTINVSTGVIKASDIRANSLSSIFVSTGMIKASDIQANSLSSIFVSTGLLKAGAMTADTLNAGATSLTGGLNMNANNISNVNTVGATTGNFTSITGNLSGNVTGNVTGNVSGNLTGNVTGNIFNTNLTIGGQYSITETADVGSALSNYGNYGTVNISGKGGLGGIVNITADVATPLNPAVTTSQLTMEAKGNYGLITPGSPVGYIPRGGLVSIVARQGLTPTPPAEVTSALFANGEIDLTAYSYGFVPGLIKLSAGANSMYAGLVTPITGIMGTNNIYGTLANTITAGTPPGVIPTFPGTNYLYGFNGTSVQNGLYVDNILNYGNGITYSNLTIGANNSKDVLINNVKTINMQNTPTIDGAGTGSINSFCNVNSSNLNISKTGYISSLTVDDIVFNRLVENFDNLFASTIFTSTITGFNNGTQTLNLINTSNINISTGRFLQLTGSNATVTAQNTVQIVGSTLTFSSQNNASLSAISNNVNIYSGLSTITTAGTSIYFATPKVQVQTHLDTPSISTLNFQATNFLATTTTIANETITGTLTIGDIVGDPNLSITASTLTMAASNFIFTSLNTSIVSPILSLNSSTLTASISTLSTISLNSAIYTGTYDLRAVGLTPIPVVIPYSFVTTGLQTFIVPEGVTSIYVNVKGASGGSNTSGAYSIPGQGAEVYGDIDVTPGETLNIMVGESGRAIPSASPKYGGGGIGLVAGYTGGCSGGGRSAIFRGDVELVTAGGGGGAAAYSGTVSNNGGGGGFAGGGVGGNGFGQDTTDPTIETGGEGGQLTRPGNAYYGNPPNNPGQPGYGSIGGTANVPTNFEGGGAGGGGFFGGGGGGWNAPDPNSFGGGGGGSSQSQGISGTATFTPNGAAYPSQGSVVITYIPPPPPPINFFGSVDISGGEFSSAGNQITTFIQTQTGSTQVGQYGVNSSQDNVTLNGKTFSTEDWSCTASLAGVALPATLAVSQSYVGASQLNGLWTITSSLHMATFPPGDLGVSWSVSLVMVPKGMAGGSQIGSVAPPFVSTVSAPLNLPFTHMSSISASTITMEVSKNMSLLANISPPSYLSTGSITIAGTNNVDVLGNVVALGGVTDVDIEALTGAINVTAASAISLTAPSITAATAVIGTPSAYGNNFAYFGNNSLASNGYDYALLQENIGRTFLNCKSGYDIRFRNGNNDIMMLETPGLNMLNHEIYSIRVLYFNTGGNIYGFNTGGRNYVDINAPPATTVPGALRLQGNAGGLFFAENCDLNMPSSNYITINQYGGIGDNSYIQLDNSKNISIKAGQDTIIGAVRDTYLRADRNIDIGNQQSNYITIGQYGGTVANSYIQFDANGEVTTYSRRNIAFNTPNEIYLNNNTIIGGNLNLQNHNINSVGNLTMTPGVGYINIAGSAIVAGGTTSALVLNAGTSRLTADSNLDIETLTGYTNIIANGGTGNIYLSGAITEIRGKITTKLVSTQIEQPVIQYGSDNTSSGNTGSVVITLSTAYTSATSYVAFATMDDIDPARISVNRDTASQITIYWAQAGSGSHIVAWNTMGT